MGWRENFLGLWNWKPGGYISSDEENSQDYSLRYNMRTIANAYAYFIALHVDGIGGDDIRRGGTPLYVWYGVNAVGREERKMYEQGFVNEGPTAEWAPNMSQLTNAVHQSIVTLWEQIAEDSSAGEWGAPP